MSLHVVARMSAVSTGDGLVYGARYGSIQSVGFADAGGENLLQGPFHPTFGNIDAIADRFLAVACGEVDGALGEAVLVEVLAEDLKMRGPIAATGLRLTLTLSETAYGIYLRFVGSHPCHLRADGSWTGGLRFIVPAASFLLPAARAAADPWQARTEPLEPLRTIARWRFDSIQIEAIDRPGPSLDLTLS